MQPTPAHDIIWIKQQLQSAIELEYSTLPLYLSAMFSLEVQNYTVYNLLRSVAMEEMVHLAIAANILAAIGGTPQFKAIDIRYPVQGLPGGAEPELRVGLAQLSKPQINNFMRIEMPDFLLRAQDRSEEYPTIAAFYHTIRQAIVDNADAIRAAIKQGGLANQVGDNIGFKTIVYTEGQDSLPQILEAIDEILDQGEGAAAEDLYTGSAFEQEESHYAKFAQIYYGKQYQVPKHGNKLTPENEADFFQGAFIGWPEVVNTLAVPTDGYARLLALDPNGEAVTHDLQTFDQGFTAILTGLDTVWNGPAANSWKNLGGAVHGMVDLRVLSCFNILRHEIPAKLIAQLPGLYGEEFATLNAFTHLDKPVYYGPRFFRDFKAGASS